MGAVFQLENRYAQIIAMVYIVVAYSAAMPVLYSAGFLLFVSMYWSDKTLFLRHYRTPPKYGAELAHRAMALLEWAVPVHFLFGLNMLTSAEIFREDESNSDVTTGGPVM